MYHVTGAILILAGTVGFGTVYTVNDPIRMSLLTYASLLWLLLGLTYLAFGIGKDYRESQTQDDTERKS